MTRARSRSAAPASTDAIVWIRVSTQEQADSNHSLANQRKRTADLAAREGRHIVKVYVGEGESAYAGDRRRWREMLNELPAVLPKGGVLYVSDLSRFSRNTEDMARAMNELRANAWRCIRLRNRIWTIRQPADSSPMCSVL